MSGVGRLGWCLLGFLAGLICGFLGGAQWAWRLARKPYPLILAPYFAHLDESRQPSSFWYVPPDREA